MDTSIELLSSMSPKINKHVKTPLRKLPTKLALKKHIRRSSLPVLNNSIKHESVITVESTSTSTCSSSSCKKSDDTPIIISDSEISFCAKKTPSKVINMSNSTGHSHEINETNNTDRLSTEKYKIIKHWVDEVNSAKQDTSLFSNVSTVNGDDTHCVKKSPRTRTAANSTLLEPTSKRFDELFKKSTKIENHDTTPSDNVGEGNLKKEINVSSQLVIELDDSLMTEDNSIQKEIEDSLQELSLDDDCKSHTQNKQRGKKYEQFNDSQGGDESHSEYETLLDSLYGNSWREKKDDILPSSEPHLHKTERKINNQSPKTERPVKINKITNYHTNPYIEYENDSNNLLKTLQKARFKKALESPWIKTLKNLCDSDSDSESEGINKLTPIRLDFKDSDDVDEGSCNNKFVASLSPLENISKKKVQTKNRKKNATTPIRLDFKVSDDVDEREPYNNKNDPSISTSDNSSKNKNKKKEVTTTCQSRSNKQLTNDKSGTEGGCYSFLSSLSGNVPMSKCDMTAWIYRNSFKEHREQLTAKLFTLYNEKIFDNAIPKDTPLEWNDRMRGTAGYCYCKKITRRTGAVERAARIVLSTKVLDSADRLRDTLVHEMCHAVTWIVNQVADGHGSFWKSWADKAMRTFPELPPIKRCHQYVINTKYTYKCTNCGYSIGRHTKSLDVERKRCGYCYGKFEVFINKTNKNGETKSVPATPKKPLTGFARFVKENYATHKTPDLQHADVMKILGQKFSELKCDQS